MDLYSVFTRNIDNKIQFNGYELNYSQAKKLYLD